MSVYRRGAIYWWCRRLKLGSPDPRSIMLRLSLKTSDKAEARSRAHALDMELQMVALRFPDQQSAPSKEKLESIQLEALRFKRDQIASLQTRPPFDFIEHWRSNVVMAHIYGALARSGTVPLSRGEWSRAMDALTDTPEEQSLFEEVASRYGLNPSCVAPEVATLHEPGDDRPLPDGPRRPFPVAPRFVLNALENAKIRDTPDNRRTAVAIMAASYQQALLEANEDLSKNQDNGWLNHLPESLDRLLSQGATPQPRPRDRSSPVQAARPSSNDEASSPLPVADAPKASSIEGGLIDLTVSEVTDLAIKTNKKSKAWQESAQRNARVISEIFIAVNGNLLMSEVRTEHLYALRDRLERMPTVWGKSAEDRHGGYPAIFARGDRLAKAWEDAIRARTDKVATVGLSVTTFNRHIRTLRQVFDFPGDLVDGRGRRTHVQPEASFRKLTSRDRRRKNTRKPVPTKGEVHHLLSGPVHVGCAGEDDRFSPGSVVIHDSAYWSPLLFAIYGNRSNEFCQLPLDHVIDKAPIPFLRVLEWQGQTVKTSATNRDLPIAPLLIHLGFLEYVRQLRDRGYLWLFPELNLTREKPSKVFMEHAFRPLVESRFPNGTSVKRGDKEIDTQSMRKFVTNYLLGAEPKIELRLRQAFVGHEPTTTIDSIYEADATVEELLPCVIKTQEVIAHLTPHTILLRSEM
ncbi:MAG: hypothetical protein K2Y17_07270 [Qipengyuania sp.]|nr:hypothetical protein [Qipengyuania sp.]